MTWTDRLLLTMLFMDESVVGQGQLLDLSEIRSREYFAYRVENHGFAEWVSVAFVGCFRVMKCSWKLVKRILWIVRFCWSGTAELRLCYWLGVAWGGVVNETNPKLNVVTHRLAYPPPFRTIPSLFLVIPVIQSSK